MSTARVSAVSCVRIASIASNSDRSIIGGGARRVVDPLRLGDGSGKRRGLPLALLPADQDGRQHGEYHEHRGAGDQGARPPPGVLLLPRAPLGGEPVGVAGLGGGVQEVGLGPAQVGLGLPPPLECLGEARAAVQLALGPAHGVPGVGRRRQVPQDPLPLDVLVEPGREARPGARQGLVRDLRRVLVGRDEARGDELLEDPFVVRRR